MVTIQDQLDRIAASDPLTAAQALDLANQVADRVEQAAAPLEQRGEFERAALLYDQAARAFEMAAEKVPGADRERVAASGELWSVKADVTRYRVYTAPPISPEEQIAILADPAAPSRPPTTPLEKLIETQDRPWTVSTPASSQADATPPPTAIKKPGGARQGQWSIAQTSPQVDESETLGAILRKLNKARGKAREKPPDEEHESPYER
jgi:hypothetical protein